MLKTVESSQSLHLWHMIESLCLPNQDAHELGSNNTCFSFWAKRGSFSSIEQLVAHNKCLVLKMGDSNLPKMKLAGVAYKSSFLVIT